MNNKYYWEPTEVQIPSWMAWHKQEGKATARASMPKLGKLPGRNATTVRNNVISMCAVSLVTMLPTKEPN